MAIDTLKTESFGATEKFAYSAAQQIEDLKDELLNSRNVALAHWVGDGRAAFESLYVVIERQIKDLSEDFWDLYDSLCDAEAAYIEADNDVAQAVGDSVAGSKVGKGA